MHAACGPKSLGNVQLTMTWYCAAWCPPTVSDTKQAFYENFKKPIPPIYNTVIQELLVQQHLLRWNHTYQYDEVNLGIAHAML